MISNLDALVDDDFAELQLQRLLGKHLLVKIAYTGDKRDVLSEELIHGTIETASRENGIEIVLAGSNQSRIIPLNAATLEMSRFRDYELTASGEQITGVDFTMSLTLRKA